MDELRDLYVQAGGFSSILHGSGIFYRGGTHVLSVLTLGGPEEKLLIDGMESKVEKDLCIITIFHLILVEKLVAWEIPVVEKSDMELWLKKH